VKVYQAPWQLCSWPQGNANSTARPSVRSKKS
jgi:hypothetical protein